MPETAEQIKESGAGVMNDVATIAADVTKDAVSKKTKSGGFKYWVPYYIAYFFQGVCYPFFYIGYHLAFTLRIKGKENLKGIKGPVIFVANHISVYDSFIFDLFVPPFSKTPPFRFMGTRKFNIWYLKILKYTGLIHLIYWLFGVFEVTYGQGVDIALVPAYEIIKNGGTVAIFPEGRVWRYDRYNRGVGEKEPIGPFKWGAAVLAKNTSALVIPVSFNQHPRNMFRDFIDVRIGKPYRVNQAQTPEALADEMHEIVKMQFNQI